jgi:hypothetical protein
MDKRACLVYHTLWKLSNIPPAWAAVFDSGSFLWPAPDWEPVFITWEYRFYSQSVKRRRGKTGCGEAEDAGGLTPAKDDNEVHALF